MLYLLVNCLSSFSVRFVTYEPLDEVVLIDVFSINESVNPFEIQLFLTILFHLCMFFFSFQLPDFLSQVKEALGLPAVAAAFPVAGPSSAPVLPVSSAPPPIVLEDEDETEGVQTLAVPCRPGSSEAFLPMVSTDDSWSTDAEFRFIFSLFYRLIFYVFVNDFYRPLA